MALVWQEFSTLELQLSSSVLRKELVLSTSLSGSWRCKSQCNHFRRRLSLLSELARVLRLPTQLLKLELGATPQVAQRSKVDWQASPLSEVSMVKALHMELMRLETLCYLLLLMMVSRVEVTERIYSHQIIKASEYAKEPTTPTFKCLLRFMRAAPAPMLLTRLVPLPQRWPVELQEVL